MRYSSSSSATDTRGRVQSRLSQIELADRWRCSPRTLEKWRQTDRGPPYLRIGGRIIYRLEDVVAFETANLRGGR